MKGYAVKPPSGRLVTSSFRTDPVESYEEYISTMECYGYMTIGQDEWRGPHYYELCWNVLLDLGYEVVHCHVEVEECGSCMIPVLYETGSQREMKLA